MAAKTKKTARKPTSGMRDLNVGKDPRGGAQKKESPSQGRSGTNMSSKRGLT